MIAITYLASRAERWSKSGEDFLHAGRDVPWWLASFSIAASWIWAPALFVSVQKAYQLGLPGIFWFTFPNILALIVFAFLAPRIRQRLPGGYTLPGWIRYRLDDPLVHKVYMIPYIWYQIMAVCVQLFVGGMMLRFLTGVPLNASMILLLAICLAYSFISGLRASIVTDFVQMVFILVGVLIIPAWVAIVAGSDSIVTGLGGLAQNRNILDPKVAFSFGIVSSIGLLSGAISDQQYWQRAFAIKPNHLVPSYVVGGLMFGIVPILLSILGFVAADPANGIAMPAGTDLPMIGVATVAKLLPTWAAVFFVVMLLSGLASTLDSALCAASSLYAIDLAPHTKAEQELLTKEGVGAPLSNSDQVTRQEFDKKTRVRAKVGMLGIAALGLATAFIVQHLFSLDRLWWIFNGVSSCFVVPTILSLYYDRLSARGVLYGIAGSAIGMVAFIYGNSIQNDLITVFSALFIVVVSLVCCLCIRRETPWKPSVPIVDSSGTRR